MRWQKKKSKNKPQEGNERIIKKFLLFPKCLPQSQNGGKQWRWLEWAWIKQKCVTRYYGPERSSDVLDWISLRWVNK